MKKLLLIAILVLLGITVFCKPQPQIKVVLYVANDIELAAAKILTADTSLSEYVFQIIKLTPDTGYNVNAFPPVKAEFYDIKTGKVILEVLNSTVISKWQVLVYGLQSKKIINESTYSAAF